MQNKYTSNTTNGRNGRINTKTSYITLFIYSNGTTLQSSWSVSIKHEEMAGKITKFPAFSSQVRVHYSTIFETKKGKRGREKLYSNHSVRIMACTWIPASM